MWPSLAELAQIPRVSCPGPRVSPLRGRSRGPGGDRGLAAPHAPVAAWRGLRHLPEPAAGGEAAPNVSHQLANKRDIVFVQFKLCCQVLIEREFL